MSSQKADIFHFDGLLLSKSHKVSAKSTQELSLVTLKSGAKFKEKLTCGFKCDMKNLLNFNLTTQKPETVTSIGSFYPKYIEFELKKYRGVIFHETEQ